MQRNGTFFTGQDNQLVSRPTQRRKLSIHVHGKISPYGCSYVCLSPLFKLKDFSPFTLEMFIFTFIVYRPSARKKVPTCLYLFIRNHLCYQLFAVHNMYSVVICEIGVHRFAASWSKASRRLRIRMTSERCSWGSWPDSTVHWGKMTTG